MATNVQSSIASTRPAKRYGTPAVRTGQEVVETSARTVWPWKNSPLSCSLYVYERVVTKLGLIIGQNLGTTTRDLPKTTFREHVNGMDEHEKPRFVTLQLKCTDTMKPNAERALLEALRPALKINAQGDLYAVWAKTVVDKCREQLHGGRGNIYRV